MTDAYRHWHVERDEHDIVWACIDQADVSTNVLSRDVMSELAAIVREVTTDQPRGLVIWSGKQTGFVSGADIKEFRLIASEAEAFESSQRGQRLFQAIEDLPCPTVAVLNGNTLGGGLELALACDSRIAFDQAARTIGLPEVLLGVLPGFGGTVRVPRLVGARRGLEFILTGKSLAPSRALDWGLVDAVVDAYQWREQVRSMIEEPVRRRRLSLVDRLLALPGARHALAYFLARQVARRARPENYPAPYEILSLWRKFGARGNQAFHGESRALARLMLTPTSAQLVRIFFLQNRLKGLGKSTGDMPRRIHVVGAGTMGGDIAAWCAYRGLDVSLADRDADSIRPALERARKFFAKRIRAEGDRRAASERLTVDVEHAAASDADIIVEAVFEDLDLKRRLLADLEKRLKPGAILATNTSSIPIERIAEGLNDPSRLVGVHFFNPVARLPLVEVIRTSRTSDATLSGALAFCTTIGKLPLPCVSRPGFLVNRILAPYMAEAMTLLEEGVPAPDIDAAAVEFGMPMGPAELADTVGLDVVLSVARVLDVSGDRRISPTLEGHVADGRLGRKSGEGFYRWRDGKVARTAAVKGSVNPALIDRLMLPMINEAARCLEDGIVDDADLVDAGAIFGTGFPPFRGGPLAYARDRGIDDVVSALESLASQHGDHFLPARGGFEKARH